MTYRTTCDQSLTAHFAMHLLAFGINFMPHSVKLILINLFLTLSILSAFNLTQLL